MYKYILFELALIVLVIVVAYMVTFISTWFWLLLFLAVFGLKHIMKK